MRVITIISAPLDPGSLYEAQKKIYPRSVSGVFARWRWGLVALTQEAELVPDGGTYGARQLASVTAPGAIVEGLRFTL